LCLDTKTQRPLEVHEEYQRNAGCLGFFSG